HVVGDDDWPSRGDPALADGAVRDVVTCARLAGLGGLAFVDHWNMTPAGAAHLARAAPPRLRLLDLSILDYDLDPNLIDGRDECAARLAASPRLAGLVELNLRNNRLTPVALRALAASPHLTRLGRLDLSENEAVDDAGVAALAGSPNLAAVEGLNLERTGVSGDGGAGLARRPPPPG